MYTIKMGEHKELIITARTRIIQGEKNADTLGLLVPRTYGDIAFANCSVCLRYILPLTTEYSESPLACSEYNARYLLYTMPITANFTDACGKIPVWLVVRDADDHIILKSGRTELTIESGAGRGCDHQAQEPHGPLMQWIEF